MPFPVMRMAPNPSRHTGSSPPILNSPLFAAGKSFRDFPGPPVISDLSVMVLLPVLPLLRFLPAHAFAWRALAVFSRGRCRRTPGPILGCADRTIRHLDSRNAGGGNPRPASSPSPFAVFLENAVQTYNPANG